MGPQLKKRKLQASATPSSKRAKPSLSKNRSRAVEASGLAWQTFDLEEFGGLEVIENVQVINDGGKVQFVVEQKPEAEKVEEKDKDDAEDDSFEGFGDEVVEERSELPGQAGAVENGDKVEEVEEATTKRKKTRQKKKQKQKSGTAVAEDESPESSAQGNVFDLLPQEEEEDAGLDMAAWAALNLSPPLLSAIAKLNFAKPTKIQKKAIPEIVQGEDVVGKAQTGSGKTLAFGIPIVEKWLEEQDESGTDRKKPIAVILSPTRELAHQLGDHLKALCKGLPGAAPYVGVFTGGLAIQKQERELPKSDIVIGTPGRLWQLIEADSKRQDDFAETRFLVVDEADRLLKDGQIAKKKQSEEGKEGRFEEVRKILGALDKKNPDAEESDSEDDEEEDKSGRQTLVFSATFDKDLQTKLNGKTKVKKLSKKKGRRAGPDEEEGKMEYLMRCLKFRREPKFIDVNPVSQMAEGLKEGLIECGAMEKDLYLYTALILNPSQRTLIFTNSISAVRRITPLLTNLNLCAYPIHSEMHQKARLRNLERFTAALVTKAALNSGHKGNILVATDVASRGLDIPNVDMVIHYHVPRQADTYVHRSGRTARGDKTGISVMLCAPEEVLPTRRLATKVHAEKAKGRSHFIQTLGIDRLIPPRLKTRVTLAKKLADAFLAKEKAHSEFSFMSKAADDLGVEMDSDMEELGNGGRGGGRKKKEAEKAGMSKAEVGALKAALREELSTRVNLGVSERYVTGGRVDVAKLLKERENGGSLFLGGDGLGIGFD